MPIRPSWHFGTKQILNPLPRRYVLQSNNLAGIRRGAMYASCSQYYRIC